MKCLTSHDYFMQLVHTVELSSDISCLISKGLWVFVGLQNVMKVRF